MSRKTIQFHLDLAQIEDLCLQNAGTLDILEVAIINEIGKYLHANMESYPNLYSKFQETPLKVAGELTEKIYKDSLNDLLAKIAYVVLTTEKSMSEK